MFYIKKFFSLKNLISLAVELIVLAFSVALHFTTLLKLRVTLLMTNKINVQQTKQ